MEIQVYIASVQEENQTEEGTWDAVDFSRQTNMQLQANNSHDSLRGSWGFVH